MRLRLARRARQCARIMSPPCFLCAPWVRHHGRIWQAKKRRPSGESDMGRESPAPHDARSGAARFFCILALGLTLSGCIGYDGDFDRGYVVDQRTLDQIKVGATTKPEALTLMGTPSTTSTVGGDAWYYIGQKMHRAMAFMPTQMTDQHVLAVY